MHFTLDQFDLIHMDVNILALNGIEATRKICSKGVEDIPVLVQATVVTEPETMKASLLGSKFLKIWRTTKKLPPIS